MPQAVARAQHVRATRDLILDAAERRFAERGFTGVSMRELAAEAGLRNQASLYNHFKNKRALYEAVLTRGIDPIVSVIAASGAAQRTGERAATPTAFLDVVIEYLSEHPHLPRLIQRAALDDSKHLRSVLVRLIRPVYSQGIKVLAETSGRWERADVPHLAIGLYQLIFGYFTSAPMFATVADEDPMSPTAIARQARFLKAAIARLLDEQGARPRVASRRKRDDR
jgi:AcrR family transcriptional regulator